MKDVGLPQGQLRIQLEGAKSFAGGASSKWCVHLEAPEKLYGEEASADWVSSTSTVGSPNPEWGADAVHTFNIAWSVPGGSQPQEQSPGAEEAFRARVIDLLEDMTKRVASLEAEVKANKSPGTR